MRTNENQREDQQREAAFATKTKEFETKKIIYWCFVCKQKSEFNNGPITINTTAIESPGLNAVQKARWIEIQIGTKDH